MVIGVEEPILIKGIGEIVAKVDSGNSGYNVIHGEDLIIQGDIITFKTENKDGQERRVSKKIKDTINVNIGGGHIQERPVIELNVQFGGQDYKKVLFSITNRKDNEHKVLLSKDFVGKELEALIDVTKDNIADDNINVDYVTENSIENGANKVANAVSAVGRGLSNAKHAVVKGAEKAIKGSETTNAMKKKSADMLKAAMGEDTGPAKFNKLDPNLVDEVEALNNLEKQMIADGKLIREQLAKEQEKDPLYNLNVEFKSDNIKVYKLLDYTGGTNQSKDNNADPQFHERLKQALQAYKNFAREDEVDKAARESKDEAEETLVKEDTNQTNQQAGQNNQQTNNQTADKEKDENKISPDQEVQGTDTDKDISDMDPKEVESVLKELQERGRAIFYIICFKQDKQGQALEDVKDKIGAYQTVIDSWNVRIARSKNWSVDAFKPYAKQMAETIKDNCKGLFAICTKPMNQRSVDFYSAPGMFDPNAAGGEEETPDNMDELVQEYNDLNSEYLKIAEDMGQPSDSINADDLQALIDLAGESSEQKRANEEALAQEYNQLNSEYLQIAEDMGQPGDSINLDDLQALIDLADESSQNKRADELGQTDPGDAYPTQNYGYHTEVEGEERIVK